MIFLVNKEKWLKNESVWKVILDKVTCSQLFLLSFMGKGVEVIASSLINESHSVGHIIKNFFDLGLAKFAEEGLSDSSDTNFNFVCAEVT